MSRCPNRTITHSHALIVDTASLMEHGVLPVAGGLLNQSAAWYRAVKIVQREANATRQRMAAAKED